jgi:hypothetical protein
VTLASFSPQKFTDHVGTTDSRKLKSTKVVWPPMALHSNQVSWKVIRWGGGGHRYDRTTRLSCFLIKQEKWAEKSKLKFIRIDKKRKGGRDRYETQ